MESRSRFRRGRLLVGALVLFAVAAVIAIPVQALSGSSFESTGGNLLVNTAGNLDWCSDQPSRGTPQPVSPTACTTTAPNLAPKADTASGQTDDSFTGGSTHEDNEAPPTGTGTIPNRKSDLTRFYVAHDTEGGIPFLYLSWERANVLGSANMDFEFNKSKTLSSNGVTPVRSDGDILITFDFTQGGSHVDLGKLEWVTTGDPNVDCLAPDGSKTSTKLPCWGHGVDLDQAGSADGSVNDNFSVYDPITFTQGGQTFGTQTVGGLRFGEAAINLKRALDLGETDCTGFASAFLKSRSSASFSSDLKDFIAPKNVDLNLCQPATIKVKKTRTDTGAALSGVKFELYKNDGTDTSKLDSGDTFVDDCTTGATGECSFDSVTGTGTVSYIVHEIAPNGFNGGADQIFDVTFKTTSQEITSRSTA